MIKANKIAPHNSNRGNVKCISILISDPLANFKTLFIMKTILSAVILVGLL